MIARFLPSLTDVAFLLPIILLFAKLNGARTLLGDGDTGWHVRTGEWILANGRVPATDMFSFSRPGQPWFAWEWLWDVLFALLHQRWGMGAVVFGSIALLCATSALLFRLIRRKCGNGLVAIALTLLATGGCATHWLARPHLFTLFFLAVTLHIADRAHDEGRTNLLWWLVPMTIVWTNLHAGFFVLFLVLGCYMASDGLNSLLDGIFDRRMKTWAYVFAACFAVTFINPYGWQLHKHIVEYIADPYQLQHVGEFQSANFHSPAVVYFEPLMILALAVAFVDCSKRRFADVFLTVGWLHLALMAQRNLPLFSIVAAPAIARGITELIGYARRSGANAWIRRSAAWFEASCAGVEENDRIGRVFLVSALPLVFTGLLLISPKPANAKLTSTYDPKFYPEKALTVLRAAESRRIFTDDEWGDYLIYHLYPKKRVFVDGRSDFYGADFGERYLDLMNVKYGWPKLLNTYAIDTILISPRFALATVLKISPDWRMVYDDGVALVFRRNTPVQSFPSVQPPGNDPAISRSRKPQP